jgi:lipopolysaccharide export system protein LptA
MTKHLSIFFFFLSSSFASALTTDVEKPVHIDADSVLFNKSKGQAVYEGNVSIVQGTLKIKAQRIEIKAPNNNIESITATGNPVSFQQKMDDGKLAKGGANKLRFLVKSKRLLMDGNAVISQNNDKFSSNHIEYSTHTGELKAGKNKKVPGSKGRVKVIFYPVNKAK